MVSFCFRAFGEAGRCHRGRSWRAHSPPELVRVESAAIVAVTSRFSFRCGLIIFGGGICRKEWLWCPIRPRRHLSCKLMIYKRNVLISWLSLFFSVISFPLITVVVWCCSFSCFFDLVFYLFCCCCLSRYCSTVPLIMIFFVFLGREVRTTPGSCRPSFFGLIIRSRSIPTARYATYGMVRLFTVRYDTLWIGLVWPGPVCVPCFCWPLFFLGSRLFLRGSGNPR